MLLVPLIKSDSTVSRENFWNSIFLFHDYPYLSNRRVRGLSQICFFKVDSSSDEYDIRDLLKYSKVYLQVRDIPSEKMNEALAKSIIEQFGKKLRSEITSVEDVKTSEDGIFISVRLLLPRSTISRSCFEFVILDKRNNVATFMPVNKPSGFIICPNFLYDIELDENNLMKICVANTEAVDEKASEWLIHTAFPKLIAWTIPKVDKSITKSLSLIPADKYCYLYQELKLKYGEQITKNWPENTDPIKFVYEDIAIAAYLLILWQRFTEDKQHYVDLGCGNGLLVHILNQEGHKGYGVDVRARKIWSMYPDITVLKVQTLIPSSKTLFPEANWIIGNHSDELTPWIPVIAARSSQHCKFFLLPCCSYEFDGKKYQRMNSGQSQYHDYLNYIKSVSNTCGFKTEMDRLRIPSTKRICLIGTERTYDDFEKTDLSITAMISARCGSDKIDEENWIRDYVARPSVETVRNCTQLDKNLVDNILANIVFQLLSYKNYVRSSFGNEWNAGGTVTLADLIKNISKEELQALKKECGGLQTLLKNHHYVFKVKKGSVQLRIPSISPNKNPRKTRKCWFFEKHPNGCFLDADSCTYLHCH